MPLQGEGRGFETLISYMKKFNPIKKGDKVRVPTWMAVHGRYNRGVVTYASGAELLVRLNFKDVVCHVYTTEVTRGWR